MFNSLFRLYWSVFDAVVCLTMVNQQYKQDIKLARIWKFTEKGMF
jgi:hypothetical protein